MPEQMIDPQESRLAAEWLLIMDRLGVDDLAAWIAQYRHGNPQTNPQWRSWEAISRLIAEKTRVTVSANGLRVRWSDKVDALNTPDVPVPPDKAAGSTGAPGGSSGSDDPPGHNPGQATP